MNLRRRYRCERLTQRQGLETRARPQPSAVTLVAYRCKRLIHRQGLETRARPQPSADRDEGASIPGAGWSYIALARGPFAGDLTAIHLLAVFILAANFLAVFILAASFLAVLITRQSHVHRLHILAFSQFVLLKFDMLYIPYVLQRLPSRPLRVIRIAFVRPSLHPERYIVSPIRVTIYSSVALERRHCPQTADSTSSLHTS